MSGQLEEAYPRENGVGGEDGEDQPLLPTSPSLSAFDVKSQGRRFGNRHRNQKFWAYSALGFVFIFLMNLIFLPRTSLSRDLRRIHGEKLTTSEMKRIFLETLTGENRAREWLKAYTFEPHLAGQGYGLVEFTEQKFQEYGLKTYVETFDTWLNRPVDVALKLLDVHGEVAYDANMAEDVLEQDETTGYNTSIPAFHGYSANGNVTAKFTYANYGMKEDFAQLAANGVDVNGTICIMRYDRIFRGLKVKHAEANGCIGAVLYSDPYEDGDVTVKKGYKAYPEGPARNPSSIQRGSVEYFTDFPGDPTTPGYGSVPGCDRQPATGKVPGIPSVPASSRSIEPILKQLNGKGPKLGWKGDIDFDYSPGPSTLDLNLFNEQEYKITPIWNVVGEIPGIMTDEQIVIANHRDSWVLGGASDPNSGSASLLEVIRGFSELLKKGYKPLRTIKFISWDGEEYSMLGSTEFGETHQSELKRKTVAYLNLDASVSGSNFAINSNPLLDEVIRQTAKETPFVHEEKPLYSLHDAWLEQSNASIAFPGAGTDYVVFQNHLGIPIISMTFTRGPDEPVYHYHSNYDSFHWMDEFGDPEFKYHICMSKFLGLLTLSLSETEVAPMRAAAYAKKIRTYYDGIRAEIPKSWLNVHLDDSVLKYKSVVKAVHSVDDLPTFATLLTVFESKVKDLIGTSKVFDHYVKSLQKGIVKDYPWFKYYIKIKLAVQIKLANYKLVHLDRLYLDDEGLVGRDWMLHTIFAPHRDLGYTGDVLPGFHEALMRGDFADAAKWLSILIHKFEDVEKKLS